MNAYFDKRKMKKIFIILMGLFLIYDIQISAQQIHISDKGCEYTVNILTGWDTIPHMTLTEKFPQLKLNIGMYPATQKEYFSDQYILIGFSPTIHTLNAFSFEQVVDDIQKTNEQTNFKSDTLSITLDSVVPVNKKPNYWINSYMTIQKDSSLLNACQTLYLSKFGYVTIMAYQKGGNALLISSIIDKFINDNNLQVDDNYKYSPMQKRSFSTKHLLFSLCIGFIVYILIAFFSKKKVKNEV